MENSEIAKIFWEISELLELKGGNRFKIRAYQKAARNLEGLSQNLENIYRQGGLAALEELPGIGKGLAEKIEQKLKTGKVAKHQLLLKQFPPGFLKLREIPSVGPKTALMLWKKLKIDTPEKLEKALATGKFKLPGFKEKKQKNLQAGLELKRRNLGRFLLSEAADYAQALVSELKKAEAVETIIPAGSLRRQQETVGDLDLLATSRRPEKIMEAFVKLPQMQSIINQGTTKSTILLKNGMQCDLRVVEPESYGAALHYFTGNKQHNIQIRELAVKKGLKLSEYGVFKGAKRIAGKSEEEVFKSIGLPFIPVELRQGNREVSAAKTGSLPELIELSDIRGDLHVHSKLSDGSNSIDEIAHYAKKMGYEYLALTDHSISTRVGGGQKVSEFLAEMRHLDQLNLKGIYLLKGVEVDILADGSLDFIDEALAQAQVVVAAVHSHFKMDKKTMTRRIIKALQNKYVNILAHPTGRLIGKREPYALDLDEIFKAARDTGTFLEVNSHPERLDLSDQNCFRAQELGIKLAINTDAHTTHDLELMRYGVATARRGWVARKQVLNTLPLKSLLKILAQKR